MERCGKFFLSAEGAIWARLACIEGLGPIKELTTAQIIFMAFATGEDTKIKSMLGPVEREDAGATSLDAELQYSQHYAEMRRLKKSGGLDKELEKKREEQKDLRTFIDRNLKDLIEEDVRKGWGLIEGQDTDNESTEQPQQEIWSYRDPSKRLD